LLQGENFRAVPDPHGSRDWQAGENSSVPGQIQASLFRGQSRTLARANVRVAHRFLGFAAIPSMSVSFLVPTTGSNRLGRLL
jgi:hypothetical protein